jgi:hypothetical protein
VGAIHTKRVLAWFAGIVAAALLLYVVGMNVLLRTRLLRHLLNASPAELYIDYSSAHSFFPGRVHVENLRIRGSDTSVEWTLAVDRCDFRAWPLDLLKRKFHASHVRADGVAFRIRMRLREEQATPTLVAALPPMPGFSDPPYLLIGPPKPPPTDADYKLISVQLDDVVAENVREVWTHSVRFTGDMRVAGRWLFRPLRWLDVGPARVDVRAMDVSYGRDHPIATSLRGQIGLTIHPYDVRVPKGLDIFEHISVRPELDGNASVAAALETLIAAPGITFAQGEGPIVVRLLVDHGVLQPGSRLGLVLPVVEVDLHEREASSIVLRSGPADLALHVDASGGDLLTTGDVDFTLPSLLVNAKTVRLATNAEGTVHLNSTSIRELDGDFTDSRVAFHDIVANVHGVDLRAPSLAVHFRRAALGSEPPDIDVDVGLPRLDAPDLRQINGLLPTGVAIAGVRIERGLASVAFHGDVDLRDQTIRGDARLSTSEARTRVGGEAFGSDLAATIRARRGAKPGDTDLSGSTLSFTGGVAHDGEAWWARAAAPTASLRLADGVDFAAKITVEAKDASPAEALVAKVTGAPRWLVEAEPMKHLTAQANVHAAPALVEVRALQAHGGSTSVRVEYARRNEDKQGAAQVSVGDLRLGVNLGGAGPDIVLFDSDSWFARKLLAINNDPQLTPHAE